MSLRGVNKPPLQPPSDVSYTNPKCWCGQLYVDGRSSSTDIATASHGKYSCAAVALLGWMSLYLIEDLKDSVQSYSKHMEVAPFTPMGAVSDPSCNTICLKIFFQNGLFCIENIPQSLYTHVSLCQF